MSFTTTAELSGLIELGKSLLTEQERKDLFNSGKVELEAYNLTKSNQPTQFIDSVNNFTGPYIKKWKEDLQNALIYRLQSLEQSGLVTRKDRPLPDVNSPYWEQVNYYQINSDDIVNMDKVFNFKDGETKTKLLKTDDYQNWKTLNSDHFNQDLKTLNDLAFFNPQTGKQSFVPARQILPIEANESLYKQYIIDKPNIDHVLGFLDENIKKGLTTTDISKDYHYLNILYSNLEGIGTAWRDKTPSLKPKNPNKNQYDDSVWTYLFGGDPRAGVELGNMDDFISGAKNGLLFFPNTIKDALLPPGVELYVIIGGVIILGTIFILK